MGCFSYLCSECKHPINSDSFSGEHCILMLVDQGTVLEWMQGQYDSYGRVFRVDTEGLGSHGTCASYHWETMHWNEIVSQPFSRSGIAAYHSMCFNGDMTSVIVSDDDPDQGWNHYKFPTEGNHSHGTPIKIEPKWTEAEII